MSRMTLRTDMIAPGQNHVYVPPLIAPTTGLPRLIMCFHGAGAFADVETLRSSAPGGFRTEAFAAAGLAQLWIDGGKATTTLTTATAINATTVISSAALEIGVYTIDVNASAEQMTVTSVSGTTATVNALTKAHVAGVTIRPFQLTGWASDADIAMASTAWAWAKVNLPVKTDKCVTYGNSAGNAWALAWAKNNPTQVIAHAGTFPVSDIKDIHDNDRQSLRTSIQQAWNNGISGTAPPDAWFAARSPISIASSLTSLPQKLWYSNDDPVCLPSIVSAYASASGATTVDIGARGHSFSNPAPYGAPPHSDIAAWLVSQG